MPGAAGCLGRPEDQKPPVGSPPRQPRGGASGQGAADADSAEADRTIEMFNWWQRVGEADPRGGLIAEHRRRFPADTIINARAGQSGLMRKTLRARILRHDPPDIFEANVGGDLMQWVRVNQLDTRESALLPLDDLVEGAAEWRRSMPAAVIEQVSQGGRIFGVPVNILRVNTIFYNKRLLASFGLTPPTSVAGLLAMGAKLRGSGTPLIALGSREPWTVALLVFEGLMVSRVGPAVYADYFHGRLAPDDPRVLATLEDALELLPFVNPDHQQLSWNDAVERVIAGRAVMTVTGDWGHDTFRARGMKLGIDYEQIPFPGSAGTFVFTSDAFALPAGARNPAGARRLLATLGSKEGQRALNQQREIQSARLDLPPPVPSALSEENHRLLRQGAMVLALSGLVPPLFSEDLGTALGEMLAEQDSDPVVHTLRSRYVLLK
jgi:glucose/mannose transport system substrate-binding protein